MATQNGTAINFGFAGTNGITGLATGLVLQSATLTKNADSVQTMNSVGEVINDTYFNQSEEASLECVVTGSSLSAALTNTTVSAPGTIVNVTACDSLPGLIQANWIVQPGSSASLSKDGVATVSLNIKRYALVTAVAS